MYIRSALAGRSSTAAVTGSHLFYAPVCCTAELFLWVLFGGTVCFSLAGLGIIFPASCSVMAIDGAEATEDQPGITFDVELVVPRDAPEVVVDLTSAVLRDLEIVPDVIGLTGRRAGVVFCRDVMSEACVF